MKILFVTHDFTKTGAPTLLLRILKEIGKNVKVEFDIATIYDRGELKEDFISNDNRYLGVVKDLAYSQKRILKKSNYDLIFLNTIVSGEVVEELSNYAPCVVWIHEMKPTIEKYGTILLEKIIRYSDYILIVDKFTLESIQEKRKAQLVRGAVDTRKPVRAIYDDRKELNLMFVATPIWRKGVFSIPDILKILPENTGLSWFGTDLNHKVAKDITYSAEMLDISKKMTIHGFQSELWHQFPKTNLVHLVLAHEEPGPLTILEAAQAGIPSICWDKGIGLADFVADDCGWVVEYLNFSQLQQVLNEIESIPDEIKRRGENARKKVLAEFTAQKRAKELVQIFENVLK